MDIEFRVCKLKEDSKQWKIIKKHGENNEFIIVGEEDKYKEVAKVFKAHRLDEDSDLIFIGGSMLNEGTYLLEASGLTPTNMYVEFDIPKEMLTLEMVEEIQRLNEEKIN